MESVIAFSGGHHCNSVPAIHHRFQFAGSVSGYFTQSFFHESVYVSWSGTQVTLPSAIHMLIPRPWREMRNFQCSGEPGPTCPPVRSGGGVWGASALPFRGAVSAQTQSRNAGVWEKSRMAATAVADPPNEPAVR